jgi:hypothetical protein
MPPLHRGRMLKSWRYVGVYGPDVMMCAGAVRIGPLRQAWWAVWDRAERTLWERTRALFGLGRVQVAPGRVAIQDTQVEADLAVHEGDAVETVTPDPGGYAWTAKHGAGVARGTVRAGAREWRVEHPALIDVSAGYHPRHTSWCWSAGGGVLGDGRAVAWNLVEGIHDSPRDSERTVWVDGRPHEVVPVRFAPDLSGIAFIRDGALEFSAEATLRRHANLLLVRSRYEQPFGTFRGTLPGGLELAEGYGVMERHDAVW